MSEHKQAPVMEEEGRGELSKGLKSRHVQMIAIGGAIGTGLFYGSVDAIQLAGPAVILAYALVGAIMFLVMRAVGEMSVEEPVAGGYVAYGGRYIHPFISFLISWYFVIAIASSAAAEFNALGRYVQYWFPNFPIWASAAIALVLLGIINMVAVAIYGEAEFWLAIIKVTAIVLMIVFGLVIIIFGVGAPGGAPVGVSNLTADGGFFAGGLIGLLQAMVMVCFAFGGVEGVSVASGEIRDVKKDMPKAVNAVFYRILIFYVGAIFVMLCLQPWDKIGKEGSPFVTIFSAMGIPAVAAILNFVVIAAALSSQNYSIYGASRMLYNLSKEGQAPKKLGKLTKRGIPFVAVLTVFCTQLLGVLANVITPEKAFGYFSSAVVTLNCIVWIVILIAHLNFRKARAAAGTVDKITFKAPLFPIGNYIGIVFFIGVLLMMTTMDFSRPAFIASPILIFLIWIAYRLMHRKKKESKEPEAVQEEE